jgi:GNAT superfamily N-acetyltransferase
LGKYLEGYGFIKSWDAPGMAIDLSNTDLKIMKLDNFEIKKVRNLALLYEWATLPVIEIYGGTKDDIDNWHKLLAMVLNQTNVFFYIGLYEGKAVTSTMLYLSNAVAGIWHVATTEEHRRKGFGTQTVLQALIDAKKSGYKMSTLFSSMIGKSVYERIGYKEYCTVCCYRYAD